MNILSNKILKSLDYIFFGNKPPTYKQRANNYFNCIIDINKQKKQNKNRAIKKLRETFKGHNVNLDKLENSWWLDFVTACDYKSNLDQKCLKRVKDYITNIEPAELSIYDWSELYNLVNRVGLFTLSDIINNKIYYIIFANYNLREQNVEFLFKSFFLLKESKYKDFKEHILLVLKSHLKNRVDLNNFEYLQNLFLDEKKISKSFSNSLDLAFYKFVKGKRLAIIAPSLMNFDITSQVEEFDIIVKFNYMEDSPHFDRFTSTRCDISYYKHNYLNKMNYLIPSKIKWAVLRDDGSTKNIQKLKVI